MGSSMIASDIESLRLIYLSFNLIVHCNSPLSHLRSMNNNIRPGSDSLANANLSLCTKNFTTVSYLSTHLPIERRLFQNNLHLLALGCSVYDFATYYQSQY